MPVYLFKQLRRKPDLLHSRPNVDFGRGFYVTPLFEQAAKWCGKFKRRGKNGIISRYEYDENQETELKTLKFDSYSEEWLDFILNCRSGRDTTNYDLVIGGVANDKVFNTVELFWDGLIDKTEAINLSLDGVMNVRNKQKTARAICFPYAAD